MNQPDNLSTTTFYRVDGTNFAFNLEWMTASGNKQSMAQARKAAKKYKATHLAWRLGKGQVGLARVPGGMAEGSFAALGNPWRSAAAAFADLPYSSLLAAFKFRDGKVWLFAATNGRVFSTGDRMYENESDALKAFNELFDTQYWNDIFAPVEWQSHPDWKPEASRAKQIDPLAVLRRRRPDGGVMALLDTTLAVVGLVARPGAALRPVVVDVKSLAKPKILTAGGIVVVALVGSIGYAKWHAAHARKPVMAAPSPYYPTLFPAQQVLDSCVAALPTVMAKYQTPGWTVTGNECVPGQILLTLAPDSNTPASTMIAFHPDADMSNPKSATITVPLSARLDQTVVMQPLMAEGTYRATFMVLNERTNSNNTVSQASPPAGTPPTINGRQRTRPYLVSQWTYETTAPPVQWAPDLANIPNLEVTNVALRLAEHGLIWSVKGNAYVQR